MVTARSGLISRSAPWHMRGSPRFLRPQTAGCRHDEKVRFLKTDGNIFERRDKEP